MTGKYSLLLLVISIFLTACSSQAPAGSPGDPEAGKALFHQTTIREAPACSTCHSIEPGKVIVGPSLAGITSRAANRKPDMLPEEYMRESILNPDTFVVEGFNGGVMYQKFEDILTEEEIDDLIAYLLTLE